MEPFLESGVKQASDLQRYDGGFIVVGDREDKIRLLHDDGSFEDVDVPGIANGNSQFEAVAYYTVADAEDGHLKVRLLLAREKQNVIQPFTWKDTGLVEKRPFDTGFTRVGNKGVEAMVALPPEVTGSGHVQIVYAREDAQHRLHMVEDSGTGRLENGAKNVIALDAKSAHLLKDLAGLALDPKTGHLFALTQEGAKVVEMRLLVRGSDPAHLSYQTEYVGAIELRAASGRRIERAEGIGFDEQGNLFALDEISGRIYRLPRL